MLSVCCMCKYDREEKALHLEWEGPKSNPGSVDLLLLLVTKSCLTPATPWTATHQSSLSSIISQSLCSRVHWVSDATQPSHPRLIRFPPTFSLSQQQGLFHWVSSPHQVATVLELQLQHQSFLWIFRVDSL